MRKIRAMPPDTTASATPRAGAGLSCPTTPAGFRSGRIWLPSPLYAAIPWIYLISGTISLLGGLYLPDWAWPLPYAVLFGVACLHAGLRIAAARRRGRERTTAMESGSSP
jgi:hypothetical protein